MFNGHRRWLNPGKVNFLRKTDSLPRILDLPVALVLLTRLPMPPLPGHAFDRQAQAAWAFPLAGLVVMLPACALGWAALWAGLSAPLAAGLVLGCQIMLTGAMHEDGVSDTADGLWGGFTSERRLEIMKDSRIGAYGVLALLLFVGLRWLALGELLETRDFAAIFAVAMLSRAGMPVLMTALPSARSGGLSQSVGVPGWSVTLIGVALACGLSFALLGIAALPVILAIGAALLGLSALAMRKIKGQTGDILGAGQILSETVALMVLTVV